MKYILALVVTLSLVGCELPEIDKPKVYQEPYSQYVKPNETLILCSSKLEDHKVLYYKSQATRFEPEHEPVVIYYITDVFGNVVSLNNYEIENYTCSKVE